jgi:IS30 family transposase
MIKWRVMIDSRPKYIWNLSRFGHYEADLIVWKQLTKPVLLVLIEKKTRFKICVKLPNKSPKTVIEIIKKYVKYLSIKSITFDNWVEFMYHLDLWIPTYFCYPFHSREKAQVERWNRDYRRFFPKKTNFEKISQIKIDIITEKINNMPMKVLDFKSPSEMFRKYMKFHSLVSVFTL